MGLFLEELSVGQRFVSRDYPVTAEAIKAFAAEFDPQPFHTDEAAARRASSASSSPAAGTRRRSPCGC